MILDFGYICMEFRLNAPDAAFGKTVFAYETASYPGGAGLVRAVASARMGGKVSLVGAVGDDLYGCEAISYLRREGVVFTGIAKTQSPTGTMTYVNGSAGQMVLCVNGANMQATAGQIPPFSLSARNFLIVDDVMPEDEVESLIKRANIAQCPVMLCLSKNPTLQFVELAKLSNYIVWNIQGACSLLGSVANEKLFEPHKGEVNRSSESFDFKFAANCYAGALAACLQAGWIKEEAASFAKSVYRISGYENAGRDRFPYIDEVQHYYAAQKAGLTA